MAVGLCSLGLAGLGVGLCKRNSVLNILGMLNRHNPTTYRYLAAQSRTYHVLAALSILFGIWLHFPPVQVPKYSSCMTKLYVN